MKLYRQVPVTERLPEKEGFYLTDEGKLEFDKNNNQFLYWSEHARKNIKTHAWWWLEELPELPTEEEIRKAWAEQVQYWQMGQNFLDGANYILKLIKNK